MYHSNKIAIWNNMMQQHINEIFICHFLYSSVDLYITKKNEISVLKKYAFYPDVSVQFSCSVMHNTLRTHGLKHTRLPCPSSTPGAYSNSCPLSQWCHPIISSSVIHFSCLQSLPASGHFPMSHFFASVGQSIGVSDSASVLPMNIQDWLPLGLTDLILQFKGLSRVFSSTTVQKHHFFSTQLSL